MTAKYYLSISIFKNSLPLANYEFEIEFILILLSGSPVIWQHSLLTSAGAALDEPFSLYCRLIIIK